MVIATDQYALMVVSWSKEIRIRETRTTGNRVNAEILPAKSMKDVKEMEFADQTHVPMESIILELMKTEAVN